MNIYCRLSEDRLYVNYSNYAINRGSVGRNKDLQDLKGFSCKIYSKPLGWLLSLIGFASFVQVDGQSCYINNRSFTKLVIRLHYNKDTQDLYEKNIYNKDVVEKVNNYIKQSLKKDLNVDYDRMLGFDIRINS